MTTISTHIVQRGDSLSELAATYKTTVSKLAELNNIKNLNKIYTGATLKLPQTSKFSATETPASALASVTSGGGSAPANSPKPVAAAPKSPVQPNPGSTPTQVSVAAKAQSTAQEIIAVRDTYGYKLSLDVVDKSYVNISSKASPDALHGRFNTMITIPVGIRVRHDLSEKSRATINYSISNNGSYRMTASVVFKGHRGLPDQSMNIPLSEDTQKSLLLTHWQAINQSLVQQPNRDSRADVLVGDSMSRVAVAFNKVLGASDPVLNPQVEPDVLPTPEVSATPVLTPTPEVEVTDTPAPTPQRVAVASY